MTRDRKLIAVFTLVGVLCASLVGVHLATATGPPVKTVDASVAVGADNRLTIQFVGDTMLGDAAKPMLIRKGYDRPFRPAMRATLDGDYVMGNLEAPVTRHAVPLDPTKDYNYVIDPVAVGALKRAGIDGFTLANNHAMDSGVTGLTDTLTYLRQASMEAVGAGVNLARAEQPLLLQSSAGTVGIVALGEGFGSRIRAEDAQAGTAQFSPETVQRGIDLARAAGADWVIAFVQWGDNYLPVNAEQRHWARMLVRAGYDAVVGAGSHTAQPISFIDGVPIVYSLGNFAFTTPGRFDSYGVSGRGLILDVELSKTEGVRLSVRCILTNNDVVHYRPRLCGARESARFLKTVSPGIVMDGNQGTLQPPGAGNDLSAR